MYVTLYITSSSHFVQYLCTLVLCVRCYVLCVCLLVFVSNMTCHFVCLAFLSLLSMVYRTSADFPPHF